MAMLHELIAKEGDLKIESRIMLQEAMKTFTARTEHFRGQQKVLTMHDEERQEENQDIREPVNETVDGKLDFLWTTMGPAMDVTASKEYTNSNAKADVIVGDQTIISDAPVTVLLALENYLTKLKDVYLTIPTLAPTLTWEIDDQDGRSVMKSNEIKTFRTEKVMEPIVLYEATKEHKAQVKESTRDVVIGTIITTNYSGMLSPAQKSRKLARISELLVAVKEARQRANTTTVEQFPVADVIKEFIDS